MKKKRKLGRKLLSFLLTLALVLGLMPGMRLTAQAETVHNHDGWTEWTTTNSLPALAGSYFLNTDVSLSTTWTVPEGTVSLCLNGHSVQYGGGEENASVIIVPSGAILNLYDEGEGEHSYSITEGLASVGSGDETFSGGYITGGKNSYLGGGGIRVEGGTLNMHGGTIIGNSGGGYKCGGVRVEDAYSESDSVMISAGNFTMSGGSIIGNYGSGVQQNSSGTFILSGGNISKNTAISVGGEWLSFE